MKQLTLNNHIIATIDIGTNSMLMLGVDYYKKTTHFLFDHYYMPRLGEGLAQSHCINQKALARAYKDLQACKKTLDGYQRPYHIFITASSAIREAENQKDIVATLEKIFSPGSIEIISGQEEARLSYLSLKDCYSIDSKNILFDIGGGSTEIAFGKNDTLIESQSIKFGTVKLLDMYFKPKHSFDKLDQAREYILQQLSNCSILPPKNTQFFGTAGSFTQCASMLLQLETYQADKIDGFKLSKKNITDKISQLSNLSIKQIKNLAGIDPKRADVILPGLIIIECLMQFFKTDSIKVYDRGIRFGKLFDVIYRYSG
ncbi:MAG TPA: hypothetical protein PKC21_04420 [Oligoflexia bacterium]|nr:hypothetical protein [Oligoflexia bacterium]HMR24582.1 hypothetical protein [Oligoflexia bacterium]